MLSTIVGAALAAVAAAHPQYVPLNPNGANAGVKAIGHTNPNGGGSTNKYGSDFDKQKKTWTTTLCKMDSDGDGLSNGLELGDPCCTWKEGGKVNTTSDISNPGDARSMTKRTMPAC